MKCIYCNKELKGNEKTNEHVIPQWIIKELNIKNYKLNFTPVSKDFIAFKPRTPVANTLTHKVCRKCNNGWLSDIDKSCTSLLRELMAGRFPKELMTISNINKLYTFLYKVFLNHFATSPDIFKKEKEEAYTSFYKDRFPPKTVELFISKVIDENKNIILAHLDHWFFLVNNEIKYKKQSGFRFKSYLQLGKVGFIICNSGIENRKIIFDPRFLTPLKCDKNITPKLINELELCDPSIPDEFINHYLFNIIQISE